MQMAQVIHCLSNFSFPSLQFHRECDEWDINVAIQRIIRLRPICQSATERKMVADINAILGRFLGQRNCMRTYSFEDEPSPNAFVHFIIKNTRISFSIVRFSAYSSNSTEISSVRCSRFFGYDSQWWDGAWFVDVAVYSSKCIFVFNKNLNKYFDGNERRPAFIRKIFELLKPRISL